jgi:hypothetical protein
MRVVEMALKTCYRKGKYLCRHLRAQEKKIKGDFSSGTNKRK